MSCMSNVPTPMFCLPTFLMWQHVKRPHLNSLIAVFFSFRQAVIFVEHLPAAAAHSFPYENYCEYYKKLASRSWPALFRLTYFSLIHTLSFSAGKYKVVAIAGLLSKLDHRPLFNDIILQDYSSVRIGFNVINKRFTLSIVYITLVKIR